MYLPIGPSFAVVSLVRVYIQDAILRAIIKDSLRIWNSNEEPFHAVGPHNTH